MTRLTYEPQVGDVLQSRDVFGRTVRIIEVHRGITGQVRKVRVENTRTERRTFLSWPQPPARWRWLEQTSSVSHGIPHTDVPVTKDQTK